MDLNETRAKVSIVCIGCEDTYIDSQLCNLIYDNVEIVKTEESSELLSELLAYAEDTESQYITFLIPHQKMNKGKVELMMERLATRNDMDLVVCDRCFEADGQRIAGTDLLLNGAFEGQVLYGKALLEGCAEEGINLYGNLATLMIRTDSLIARLRANDLSISVDGMMTVLLNYLLLMGSTLEIMREPLVTSELSRYDEGVLRMKIEQYETLLLLLKKERNFGTGTFAKEEIMPVYMRMLGKEQKRNDVVERKITFFYTDKGEYYNLEPISREAARRGYDVCFTQDLKEKAEIGIYCQHTAFGYSQNSKFSVVLLHDLAQGHNRWPDIWNIERWNSFDMCVLPNIEWADRWSECASMYWSQPALGAYLFGYPKSVNVHDEDVKKRISELKQEFCLKYDRTVLYAPSWENDGKEDEFVRALASLEVNLLIKQAHWPDEYADITENIEAMRAEHEGKYENVYYIEPEESILVALGMCDLVVSDESNVMIEALMFEKPSIAVMDWLIPDEQPPRFASVPFDCVYKCKKAELREYVERILFEGRGMLDCKKMKEENFFNTENVNKDIMDAIEYYTSHSDQRYGVYQKYFIEPAYMPAAMWD